MESLAPVLDGQVLIAEDDRDMRALLEARFRHAGIEVDLVADGSQLRDRLFNGHPWLPQVLVSDVKMPGASGLEVLQQLRARDAEVRVVLITAFGDARTHRRAEKLGAEAVLDKPFDVGELLTVVNGLLDGAA
jgi:DNA-binding response OmpR family regulator